MLNCFPGEFVNCFPGEFVNCFPGEFVNCFPGEFVDCFPGEFVNCFPGEFVNCFPGEFLNWFPGEFVNCFPGEFVKLLIHTGVTRYLEFKSVEGSYVYKAKKIHKVPANEKEALTSGNLCLFCIDCHGVYAFMRSRFMLSRKWCCVFKAINSTRCT